MSLNNYLVKDERAFRRFKWIANSFVFVGAAVISLSPTLSQQYWPFLLADIGSVMWLWAASIMKDRALIAFNIFFVLIQTGAIIMRLNN